MERNVKFVFTIFTILLAGFIIAGYGYYQSKDMLKGPSIMVKSPVNGATLMSSKVIIEGVASNVSYLRLNDSLIFTDGSGHFIQKLLLSPGYNILKLEGRDRFGRSVEKTLELVYKESPVATASSTAPAI